MEPFERIGRIVSRGKVAGLFLGMGSGLPAGIYEIRRVMGELQVVELGPSALQASHPARYTGLDLEGVFNERPLSCMTQEELEQVAKSSESFIN